MPRPPALNMPSLDWFADSLYLPMADMGKVFTEAQPRQLIEMPVSIQHWRNDHVVRWAPGVYSFPYMHKSYAIKIADYMLKMGHDVNDEEPEGSQIQECVLGERDPQLLENLQALWRKVGMPVAWILRNMWTADCASIQGALYTPDGTSSTQWHHDVDGEFTLTVALTDPTRFEGGGTDVMVDGIAYHVAPLPIGHALIFAGRSTIHKGCPVTSGTRQLLVHWAPQTFEDTP